MATAARQDCIFKHNAEDVRTAASCNRGSRRRLGRVYVSLEEVDYGYVHLLTFAVVCYDKMKYAVTEEKKAFAPHVGVHLWGCDTCQAYGQGYKLVSRLLGKRCGTNRFGCPLAVRPILPPASAQQASAVWAQQESARTGPRSACRTISSCLIIGLQFLGGK